MIVDFAGRRPSKLTDIIVWHHGGAMSRVGESDTAYGGRDAAFLVSRRGELDRPGADRRGDRLGPRRLGRDADSTRPAASTSTSPASARRTRRSSRAGYGANYERLGS